VDRILSVSTPVDPVGVLMVLGSGRATTAGSRLVPGAVAAH